MFVGQFGFLVRGGVPADTFKPFGVDPDGIYLHTILPASRCAN